MKKELMIQEYAAEIEMQARDHILPAQYLLVLQPHEALWDEIGSIKKKFSADYRFEDVKIGLPHITLAMFRQFQSTENRIVQSLRNNARAVLPFKVELKDFGSFPSHTIYINIVSKVPVMNVVKTLRQNAQKFMKMDRDNKPYFITEPHLTLARKLQPWQYEKSWLEYKQANFHGRFIADHALLLRRKSGGFYKEVEKFRFEGIKAVIRQTELFAP